MLEKTEGPPSQGGKKCLEIKIVDASHCEKTLRVYGEIPRSDRKGLTQGSVVKVLKAKVGEDRNRKYVHVNYHWNARLQVLDKEHPEAQGLLKILLNNRNFSSNPVKTVSELKLCAEGVYILQDVIVSSAFYASYWGCTLCATKLQDVDAICTRCSPVKGRKKLPPGKNCLRVSFNIEDSSARQDGALRASAFGDVAIRPARMKADTFLGKSEQQRKDIFNEKIRGREFDFIEIEVFKNRNRPSESVPDKNWVVKSIGSLKRK